MITSVIFHICGSADWQRQSANDRYAPAALSEDGFVHCSDPGTVHLPANRLYAGRGDLVLLEVDPTRLDVPLRWEPGIVEDSSGPWFPHVYGSIPVDSVVAVHPFSPDADGRFEPRQPES